jgi:hypothetical protein
VGWIGSKKPLRPLSTEEFFNQWNQSSQSSSVVSWPREIAIFFNSIFKDGIPLARITGVEKKDATIEFSYDSRVSLKKADFFYTSDTLHINAERLWQSVPAKILERTIVSPCPKEGYKMGFLYTTDVMDLGVSSGLIIN